MNNIKTVDDNMREDRSYKKMFARDSDKSNEILQPLNITEK
jgi:hypothetical protein